MGESHPLVDRQPRPAPGSSPLSTPVAAGVADTVGSRCDRRLRWREEKAVRCDWRKERPNWFAKRLLKNLSRPRLPASLPLGNPVFMCFLHGRQNARQVVRGFFSSLLKQSRDSSPLPDGHTSHDPGNPRVAVAAHQLNPKVIGSCC